MPKKKSQIVFDNIQRGLVKKIEFTTVLKNAFSKTFSESPRGLGGFWNGFYPFYFSSTVNKAIIFSVNQEQNNKIIPGIEHDHHNRKHT